MTVASGTNILVGKLADMVEHYSHVVDLDSHGQDLRNYSFLIEQEVLSLQVLAFQQELGRFYCLLTTYRVRSFFPDVVLQLSAFEKPAYLFSIVFQKERLPQKVFRLDCALLTRQHSSIQVKNRRLQ